MLQLGLNIITRWYYDIGIKRFRITNSGFFEW